MFTDTERMNEFLDRLAIFHTGDGYIVTTPSPRGYTEWEGDKAVAYREFVADAHRFSLMRDAEQYARENIPGGPSWMLSTAMGETIPVPLTDGSHVHVHVDDYRQLVTALADGAVPSVGTLWALIVHVVPGHRHAVLALLDDEGTEAAREHGLRSVAGPSELARAVERVRDRSPFVTAQAAAEEEAMVLLRKGLSRYPLRFSQRFWREQMTTVPEARGLHVGDGSALYPTVNGQVWQVTHLDSFLAEAVGPGEVFMTLYVNKLDRTVHLVAEAAREPFPACYPTVGVYTNTARLTYRLRGEPSLPVVLVRRGPQAVADAVLGRVNNALGRLEEWLKAMWMYGGSLPPRQLPIRPRKEREMRALEYYVNSRVITSEPYCAVDDRAIAATNAALDGVSRGRYAYVVLAGAENAPAVMHDIAHAAEEAGVRGFSVREVAHGENDFQAVVVYIATFPRRGNARTRACFEEEVHIAGLWLL